MKDEIKDKIRPIYSELQGYLSQTMQPKNSSDIISDDAFWNQYNKTIDELNSVSGNNYDRFKIQPIKGQYQEFVRILTYRNKLGGLISRLHGEFYLDDPVPFSGMPATVISQTQQQAQSFQVQMLLEIQGKIDEKIPKFDKGTKERNFLEKVKNSLSLVRNFVELVLLLLRTGKDIGLTLDQVLNIFK